MKRFVKQFIGALLISTTLSQAACTQEEAINMMMALTPYGQQLLNEETAMDHSNPKKQPLAIKTQNYNTEMSLVGAILAEEEYTKACEAYTNIASKYELDLKELMKTSPTLASISAAPEEGKCSLADASIKLMNLITAAPSLDAKEPQALIDIQMGLVSDPAKACDDMDKLITKYSIEMEEPE